MSIHISGAVVTHHGIANNNRGENEGNITTLQKLLWLGRVHTTVSSEAIRWAVRYRWQRQGLKLRRTWDDHAENYHESDDFNPEVNVDDDLMGYMLAEGAKQEGEKGTTSKRRGVMEVARAVSLQPFAGDVTFNARAGTKDRTSLYGSEIHATRYQYGFSLTPERLYEPQRLVHAIDAVVSLGEVAGNHSRFLYDFSPESIVLRVSHDPSPRLLYCFEADKARGAVSAPKLRRAVQVGDIAAEELIVGGLITDSPLGQMLQEAGVTVVAGVREAGRLASERALKEVTS